MELGDGTRYWFSVAAEQVKRKSDSSDCRTRGVTILNFSPVLCQWEETLGSPAWDRKPFCWNIQHLSASRGFLHSCLASQLTPQCTMGLLPSPHKVSADQHNIHADKQIHNNADQKHFQSHQLKAFEACYTSWGCRVFCVSHVSLSNCDFKCWEVNVKSSYLWQKIFFPMSTHFLWKNCSEVMNNSSCSTSAFY